MSPLLDTLIWWIALPTALFILANGLDDLLVDLNYLFRGLGRVNRRLDVDALKARPRQRIAVMVPAWHEAAVIEQMLENAVLTVDYPSDRYTIFVGTYRNDPETQERVDAVARRVPNVRKVVVPHDGPTSKADCLNWIWQGIRRAEEEDGRRYDILVMQDAEDVVHPLALLVFNAKLPEADFVQTPVLPLQVPLGSLVGATYMDQFVEQHLKDLLVRDAIGGLVPSAGVGSGFARDAFEAIALANRQEPFDPSSLTEDYDIALKFRLAGRKTAYCAPTVVRHEVRDVGWLRPRRERVEVEEVVATREFFPTDLRSALRQRSRWIVGITLQAWEKVGWKGSPAVLWCLWRDRKALFTHVAIVAGYVVAAYLMARIVIAALTGSSWSFENVIPTYSFLWWLVLFNGGLLLWRTVVKMGFVRRQYGLEHALLAFPRFVVGNFVDFGATALAVRQWAEYRITGVALRWRKTEHVFPDMAALAPYHQRLTDFLTDELGTEERRRRAEVESPAK